MKHTTLLALTLAMTPLAALAMPAVGDVIGTNPTDAVAALTTAGCEGAVFESEGGKIDARCTDSATGVVWEFTIDPKSGAITDMKQGD